MINPNGEGSQNNPLAGTVKPSGPQVSSESAAARASARFQETSEKVSAAASDAWRQTKAGASTAREKTEHLVRENPVPTIIGALALGLAIGLAIRYSSDSTRREPEPKSLLGDVNLGLLSLPFLWPFFKSAQKRYLESADAVRDGVEHLKGVDVDRYMKPLRKKWRAWTD